ncbi:MAG: helicase SNF2, partial [Chromatiaceae bacterium]|nr:helicase SNF2 [Chromatiaceae bacterium]
MVNRFSSRRQRLGESFLAERLRGAQSDDRIAGFFSSSILEVAGEELQSVSGTVRLICNSVIDARDLEIAKKAAQHAMRREWCDAEPEKLPEAARPRFHRLYRFLASGKLQVKVMPDEKFGLIHGKAGVITLANGRQTAFLGSVNESLTAWRLNYELLWEDDSDEAVRWVQEEFDTLWHSPFAVELSEAIVQDIKRIAERSVIADLGDWQRQPEPAAPVVEAPVYRKEVGLWAHQKHFVKLAFEAHLSPQGARFVLADQVGLGKTIQLAMAAQLMALSGSKPALVLAPKPLIWQWQGELHHLLDMPSAVWDGQHWVDENRLEHPSTGPESVRKCPRRIGIVSTGLIISGSEIKDWLVNAAYECVILDEAHRARRRNLSAGKEYDPPQPNNLLRFLWKISPRTREYLENTIDPESGDPFLKPVEIRLHGERDEDAIALPPFLEDAYHHAEEFCRLLAERANAGFVRTLLLRRVGSTIEAGRKTVEKMLSEWSALDDDEDDGSLDQLRTLTSEERAVLQRFLRALEANQERDPKYQIVRAQLLDQGWRELGCIIFSQFFDSVYW